MKPSFITDIDWQLLKEKYPSNLNSIVDKLNNNYPVQYLIGNVEFLNTTINVNENVLIPRFETEYLVEKTIAKIKNLNLQNCSILDLGTGSGCISIALKKNLNCQVTAVDNSISALKIALENAKQNNVSINFQLASIENFNIENYDIIISNPPYVEILETVDEKTKYEPQNAIFALESGLYYYRIILEKIGKIKNKPKLIAFEIGIKEGEEIIKLAKQNFKIKDYSIEKDLTNRNRYIFIKPNV